MWLAGRKPAGAKAPVSTTNSLAVLPFADLSQGKDQEYFSDGLTEELLNVLVKVPNLKVAGRTSSFSFKGKNEDLRTIGQKLGVANILEGSVRKSGDRIRITAQLVKADDGFHLWSETYDRTLDDVFAVQDEIAKNVAEALKVTLLGQNAGSPKPDAAAYDLVLQARHVMMNRTEANIRFGRELLDRALKLSPDYAPAWATLGLVHARTAEMAVTIDQRRKALDEARKALAKALELDPNLAVAHSRMASIQMDSWDFDGAERSTALAIAADPRNSIILGNASHTYAALGQLDKALSLSERVREAEPLNATSYINLANIYLLVHRFEQAEAVILKADSLGFSDPFLYGLLGSVRVVRGDIAGARAANTKFVGLSGMGDYAQFSGDAILEFTAGNPAKAQAAAAEFERRFGADDPTTAAMIRAWRGEADAAFAWLEKAYAARDPQLGRIYTLYELQSLQKDPRWNALLKKIGLPIVPPAS